MGLDSWALRNSSRILKDRICLLSLHNPETSSCKKCGFSTADSDLLQASTPSSLEVGAGGPGPSLHVQDIRPLFCGVPTLLLELERSSASSGGLLKPQTCAPPQTLGPRQEAWGGV